MKKLVVSSLALFVSVVLVSNVFARMEPFVPIEGTVGVSGTVSLQESLVDTIFDNAGNYTFFQKQGTSAGDVEDRATPTLWVKAICGQEKVEIAGLYNIADEDKVKTEYYGLVAGLDFDRQYSKCFDATYGFFVSYVNNNLKLDEDIYSNDFKLKQNIGFVGVRGNWYIGKLFVNGIIDYGMSFDSAEAFDESKDYKSQVIGLAAKVGYNWEVANKSFTIQPGVAVKGDYVFMEDLNIKNSSVDNVKHFAVEPGLKLAKTLGKCWILTGEGKYVVEDFSDKMKIWEDSFYDIGFGNYTNVGLGIEKIWGYTVLNLKANKTFGSRDGYIVRAGAEFKF